MNELEKAAAEGDLERVDSLLEEGADPNAHSTISTPFSKAVEGGHDAVALRLLRAGADPVASLFGAELLGQAVYRGMVETLGALFGPGEPDTRVTVDTAQLAGADDLRRKKELQRRLHEPSLGDEERAQVKREIAELRRQQLAFLDLHDGSTDSKPAPPAYREAPLVTVAAGQGRGEIVDLLLAAGADPELADGESRTPAEVARESGHREIAERLDEAARRGDHGERRRVERGSHSWIVAAEPVEPTGQSQPEPSAVEVEGPEGFRRAVAELAALCAATPRPWDERGGVDLTVDSRSEGAALGLRALQERVAGHGVTVVASGRGQGLDQLTVLPVEDPSEAIAVVGVAGPNWGVTTEQIADFFRRHPARLERLRYDTVAGRFLEMDDPAALAAQIAELCPDTLEELLDDDLYEGDEDEEDAEGDEDPAEAAAVAELARRLESTGGEFSLWWD